jgi:hypothetical protein
MARSDSTFDASQGDFSRRSARWTHTARVRERSTLLCRAVAIAVCAFAVWVARVQGPYHFDDWVTPVGDPASQSLSAFVEHLGRTLRPLSKLSFALEATLGWADQPAMRRVVSVLVHGLTSGLVFLLAARLGAGLWAAAAASVLFALHPIHAEAVWALAGRGAALGLLFVIAALLAHWRGRRWLAAGLLLAACLCRETSVFGALALGALELARRTGDTKTLLRRLEPVASVVLVVIAFVLQNARYRELIDYSLHGRPQAHSVAGQIEAVPLGLSLHFRLGALSIDHGERLAHSFGAPGFWLGVVTLLGFVALAAWACLRRRALVAVGAALVLAALIPTQTFVAKLDPLTERPFAAALAGVALLVAAGARAWFRHARFRRATVGAFVALALVLGHATLERGELYASDVALFRDAAEKSLVNARPHYNLALALLAEGRAGEAATALERARKIDPFDSEMRALAAQLKAGLASPDLHEAR